MHVVTVVFEVHEAEAEKFRKRVRQQAADSVAREPGCRRFDVSCDPGSAARFFLYEIYDSQESFDGHRETPHYQDFNATVTPWVTSKEVKVWRLEDWPLDT